LTLGFEEIEVKSMAIEIDRIWDIKKGIFYD